MNRLTRITGAVFDRWETEILRPVITSLLTAAAVFLLSLLSPTVRNWLFPGSPDYPIECFAEMTKPAGGNEIHVEFYIVNLANEDRKEVFRREDLAGYLNDEYRDFFSSPDIVLRPIEGVAIRSVEQDRNFNTPAKGHLLFDGWNGNEVKITIDRIAARAILRLDIVTESPFTPGSEVDRIAKQLIPLNTEDYEDRCFQLD